MGLSLRLMCLHDEGREVVFGAFAEQRKAVVSSEIATHHVTGHNTFSLSTAPQLSVSQNALGTLPEDGNVMLKHVEATIHSL
jgi:hypothetical protein